MRKPFENTSGYDPGRFRFSITFFTQSTVVDGFAGTRSVLLQSITTMAVQEKLSERSQLAIEAGASVLNQDCYFVIRQRNDFTPAKDMIILCNGSTYVIKAIVPIDVPVRYIKILGIKKDFEITT
jgi:SPP1 family predicted phage head-tail adaptor